ncbi:hypothetical protein K438DRAFT_542193 [Mycena galopus ATCC 62051]|nr:hypothetical protein K438DRAFT_542193 [Mycena galopus ATCC 62051]
MHTRSPTWNARSPISNAPTPSSNAGPPCSLLRTPARQLRTPAHLPASDISPPHPRSSNVPHSLPTLRTPTLMPRPIHFPTSNGHFERLL